MKERGEYKKIVHYAGRLENKGKVMSSIIDKMDQKHSNVPYLGTQSSFSHPIEQGVTGILEHGAFGEKNQVTLYRTFGTVKKGADLTIYCISCQIEAFRRRHKKFPEELYIQLDGGSENANAHVLAYLELLVSKRVARLIYFTRLPTGHTHEDIDAVFAHVWVYFRIKPVHTLEEYKDGIEKAFRDSKLSVEVKDVMVVLITITF
jgi:hypothetical protein